MQAKGRHTVTVAIIGGLIVILIMVMGTIWMGRSAKKGTDNAVRKVSLLYLNELSNSRAQVVEANLQNKIGAIRSAIDLMTEEDLSDITHLHAYQNRMNSLYSLDKFAFVNADGLIYTAKGMLHNIYEYGFDYQTLSKPEISIFNPNSENKQVIIAVPIDVQFQGKTLKVCFMAIDMMVMLSGVSMD